MTGKELEALIKMAAFEQGIDYTRLKDAGWTGEETTRRFTSRNVCDCIMFRSPSIYFVEIKHRLSALRFDNITQLDDLKKKHNPEIGVHAGVLCMLKGQMFWVTVPEILSMQDSLGKKSFNSLDAELYGLSVNMITPKGKRKMRPDLGFI